MVIFGASGDLSKRKLLPALYRLAYERQLPSTFSVIGTSRTPLTDDAFRDKMREAVKQFLEDSPFDEELWKSFAANLHYVAGDMGDPGLHSAIKDKVTQLGLPNVLFYPSSRAITVRWWTRSGRRVWDRAAPAAGGGS
jgi:glucose-6-phosphate 1-dehydrogenase